MSLPRQPCAVIFDMDGLLFDSETAYRDAVIATARTMGYEFPEALFLRMVGLTWADNEHQLFSHFGPDFPATALRTDAVLRLREHSDAVGVAMKAGVVETLNLLDDLGLPRAIATSSHHEDVEHHLAAHGLLGRFHAVVAQGDYARAKPNPDPYLLAAQRLGVAPEFCLALEDSHNGVRSASAAGMMTVMVPDLLETTDEMRALCVYIADDLHAVRGLLVADQIRSSAPV